MAYVHQPRAETDQEFHDLVLRVEPTLRRAFVALYGAERGRDAVAEALAYAWEHRSKVLEMANPAGYLYRVGQTRSRQRKSGRPRIGPTHSREPEPELFSALRSLSRRQRVAVVLCIGYSWTYEQTSEFMGISRGAVQKHVDRGLTNLRRQLGAPDDD